MKYRSLKTFVWAMLVCPALALAHGGGVDSNGGHNDRKNGGYHCHKEPCASQHQQADDAYDEAVEEKRAFTNVYDRDDWKHWVDADKDCQDTREEALIAHSQVPVTFKTAKGCDVIAGRWYDPYTDQTFTDPSGMDIDHMVPLGNAHVSGGFAWSAKQKEIYANDLTGLIPVDLSANRSKNKRSPDQWMPTNKAYHCDYIEWWLSVKTKYGLGYTEPEKHSIQRIQDGCGN